MVRLLNYLFVLLLFFVCIFSCAKKGSPTGGPKDETVPLLVITKPAHKSTFFDDKEIRIYFDEYIVLKDLTNQLIISPPLKTQPIISPQGTASKYLKIKISDTLRPNTTYTFNFGNAIRDNNEGNVIEDFKYIFSTGSYIDSLKTTGSVVSALEGNLNKNISVLLYEYDSTFTDSIIYKQKPKYVTRTLDSLHFQFTNIKEGKYFMLAIDEDASDYLFSARNDKIAFLKDTIHLPQDSILNENLVLFKEEVPYKFKKGREISKGKIVFGYEGRITDFKVNLLSKTPEDFKTFSEFEKETDTLNYWFTPIEGIDSLNFTVTNQDFIDTLTVKLRKKKIDSLKINASISGTLHPLDTFVLKTNNPIVNLAKEKFSFVSDSLPVDFDLKNRKSNELALIFEKKLSKNYLLEIAPEGLTDLYGCVNDSLTYNFRTQSLEDYGSITIVLARESDKPVIIELLTNNKVIRKAYLSEQNSVEFTSLEPLTYKVRAIIDDNENKRWDTGTYLKKNQPETIIVLDKDLELRPNWTLEETIAIP